MYTVLVRRDGPFDTMVWVLELRDMKWEPVLAKENKDNILRNIIDSKEYVAAGYTKDITFYGVYTISKLD